VVVVVCAAKGLGSPNLVPFGSPRGGSDPARCRHSQESLGGTFPPLSPFAGGEWSVPSSTPGVPSGRGSPPARQKGRYAGAMCRRGRLLWRVAKDSSPGWRGPKLAAKRLGRLPCLSPWWRGGLALSPPFPVFSPINPGGGMGGVLKPKQIGTAGVVHISVLGVKSYDYGKMN